MNGRPMYQHESCPLYIYYFNGTTDFWMIGSNTSDIRGYAVSYENASSPVMVTNWQVYDDVTSTLRNNTVLHMVCKCEG